MFEKSLTTLIKGLRSHRGKDEAKYIASMLDEIRTEVKSADMDVKAEAVLKLAYLRMLGYEVKSASFSMLEAMASSKYHVKHIGYLAAALCFSEDTEVLILATNLIKKELAQHLSEDIAVMLTHSRARVRKRAVLVLYSAIVKYPQILDRTWERMRDLLCDPDQGVVTATVNAVCELARRNPAPFVPLSPQLFEILTNTSNNWLLIKVVKLFGALARVEPRLVRKLLRPISEIISTTPAMSVLYECIHTAIIGGMLEGAGSEDLALRCVDNLGRFLEDSDQNLKYIALLALAKLVPTHPGLVAQHQDTILACIRHPDMTIRLRALDLVCQLSSRASLRTILDTFVQFLEEMDAVAVARDASSALQSALDTNEAVDTAPETLPTIDTDEMAGFRVQVAECILDLGSAHEYGHVTDVAWYLATLQRLIRTVDVSIAQSVADQMIDIVWRFASLRPEACRHFQHVLLQNDEELFDRACPTHELLRTGAWICSEYPDYLDAPQQLARILMQDTLRELPANTVAVVIQSTMKLYAHYAASLSEVWDAEKRDELEALTDHLVAQLEPLVHHQDSDVHERAQESLQLFTLLKNDLAKEGPAPAAPAAAPEVEANSWDDEAATKQGREGPRALHLLEPLYYMREDDEDALATLPASFDLHAWIMPEDAWKPILDLVEPAPKLKVPKAVPESMPRYEPEEAARAPKKAASTRTKVKKTTRTKTPAPAAEDDDLKGIPIVQLDLSDLMQKPAAAAPSSSSASSPAPSDTQAAHSAVQPKMVTRKKKTLHGNTGDIKKTISIAILLCGNPSQSTVDKFGSYDNMFRHVFTEALATVPRHEWHPKISLYIRSFNVTLGEFPDVSQLDDGLWDAVVVTGTPDSCTNETVLWMDVLRKYLVHLVTVHPLIRVIGICFGHQIVAQAFGGKVVQDKANAEFGVVPISLTSEGTELLSPFDDRTTWRLEQLHEDSVSEVPPPLDGDAWAVLGSTEKVPVQGLALRYPTEAPPLPSSAKTSSYIAFDVDDSATSASGPLPIRSVHVLTLQGHPEFNVAVTENELKALHDAKKLDESIFDSAIQRASDEQDGLETARMMLAMLGMEPATAVEGFEM